MPRSLSVMMVIQSFYPHIGGAENQCLQLSRALIKKGVRVTVLTQRPPNQPKEEMVKGVPVLRLGWAGPRLWHSLSFMASTFLTLIIRAREYQVIHAHLASSHAVTAALVGFLLKKKVIVKIGGGNEIGEIALSRQTFFGRWKLRALGLFKPQLVVVSEEQKKELRGFHLDRLDVVQIPNGVDTNVYHPVDQVKKNELRQKLGWNGEVFLFVGRFHPNKIRVDIFENLLKAWSSITEEKTQRSMSLFLVGEGPLENIYKELIGTYKLGGSVHLLKSRQDVVDLYQAADYFMLPSLTEGLSNALLEAMACGLPVLVSRVPGLNALVSEGVQGTFLDPLSPNNIENALRQHLMEPTNYQSMSQQCLSTANRFSIEGTVLQYINLYQAGGV